ncbi:hypothetical protein LZ32DRAFT_636537 [Colletotrichum eremochloae]|nr:hypothetical protein LZ32DRAFT_636537 [Colletotrichum eremochloae]
MQVGILLLIAATARAAADTDSNSTSPTVLLSAAPACSVPCLIDGYNYGKCTPVAVADCVCTNVPLQARVSECVQKACEFPDQVATVHITQKLCRSYPKQAYRHYDKIFSIALPSLTIVIVALRCVARIQVTKTLWWDDATALIALGFVIVLSGVGLASANLGYGSHYWDIDPTKGKAILKIFYAQQMLYIVVLAFAKTSIACFYYRVFINPRFLLAIKWIIAFLFAQSLLFIMLLVFQCRPIESNWDRYIEGQCFNVTAIAYVGAVCSILADVLLVILPIPEVLKLQLSGKNKTALFFLFALGSLACVASIVRLQYLVSFANSYDASYENVMTVIWSAVELNLAIICGSLPSLRPLFKRARPAVLTGAKSATRKDQFSRLSIERSATARIELQVSRDDIAQSSQGSTPSKPEPPIDLDSVSTTYDTHLRAAPLRDIESGRREDFELENWEIGRKN